MDVKALISRGQLGSFQSQCHQQQQQQQPRIGALAVRHEVGKHTQRLLVARPTIEGFSLGGARSSRVDFPILHAMGSTKVRREIISAPLAGIHA